jgi:hypothetical protein
MGAEYKIEIILNSRFLDEVTKLIKSKELFEKTVVFNGKEHFEFRNSDNKGRVPNFTLIFEENGIYICKHDCSSLWENLVELKSYLDFHLPAYSIIDFDD